MSRCRRHLRPSLQFSTEADLVATALESGLSDMTATYDRAAALAPGHIAADIALVRDGTARFVGSIVELYSEATTAGDPADLADIFGDEELAAVAVESGQAASRLDDFTIPSCGFRLSNT